MHKSIWKWIATALCVLLVIGLFAGNRLLPAEQVQAADGSVSLRIDPRGAKKTQNGSTFVYTFPDLEVQSGEKNIRSVLVSFSESKQTADAVSVDQKPEYFGNGKFTYVVNQANPKAVVLINAKDQNTGCTGEEWQEMLRECLSVTLTGTSDIRKIRFNATTTAVSNSAVYFSGNGHYYEYVKHAGIRWTDAYAAALQKTYFGQQGYLATITSKAENDFVLAMVSQSTWLGGTCDPTYTGNQDSPPNKKWIYYWVCGPEKGKTFVNRHYTGTTDYDYADWRNQEPNNSGGEQYLHLYFPSGSYIGWNDFSNNNGTVTGYIVEYDPAQGSSQETFTIDIALDNNERTLMVSSQDYYDSPDEVAPVATINGNPQEDASFRYFRKQADGSYQPVEGKPAGSGDYRVEAVSEEGVDSVNSASFTIRPRLLYRYGYTGADEDGKAHDSADVFFQKKGIQPGAEEPVWPAEEPTRAHYQFLGWSASPGDTEPDYPKGEDPAAEISVAEDTDFYAVWKINSNRLTVKDYGTPDDVTVADYAIDYGAGVLNRLNAEAASSLLTPPSPDSSFLGWTTTPDDPKVNVDESTAAPDRDLTVYPVWGVDASVGKNVKNTTSTDGANRVNDVLVYTITAENRAAGSVWRDVTVRDRLPAGVTLIPGSISLRNPDGSSRSLADSEAYDAAGHMLAYHIGPIYGNEQYVLTFRVKINSLALDHGTTKEAERNRDLSNRAEAVGKNTDGTPLGSALPADDPLSGGGNGSLPSESVTPNPGPDGTPGKVTPEDPAPSVTKGVKNKNHPSGPSVVDDVLTYTITAKNERADSLWSDVTIRDRLPEGLTLVSGSIRLTRPNGAAQTLPDSVYQDDIHTLVYHVGPIYGSELYSLSFDVKINRTAVEAPTEEERDISNRAEASGRSPDGRNVGVGSGSVPPPGGGAVQWKSPRGTVSKKGANLSNPSGPTRVGNRVSYRISAANREPDSLWKDVVLYDPIPEGMTVDTASIVLTRPDGEQVRVSSSAYDPSTRVMAVYVGSLYGGQSCSLYFEAFATQQAVHREIGNVAYAVGGPGGGSGGYAPGDPYHPGGGESLPDMGNDRSAVTAPAYPTPADEANADDPDTPGVQWNDPDPVLTKNVVDDTRDSGVHLKDLLTYTVTLKNATPGSLWKNVFIFDYLPDGLSLQAGSMTLTYPDGHIEPLGAGRYNSADRTIMIPIPQLAGGQSYTLTYKARVQEPEEEQNRGKPIVNRAEATGENPDGTKTNAGNGPQASAAIAYPTGGEPAPELPRDEVPGTGERERNPAFLVIIMAVAAGCGVIHILLMKRKKRNR